MFFLTRSPVSPFRTMHHAPCTMHHAPCTMHHAPCTTHHAPRTTHHASCYTQHVPFAFPSSLRVVQGGLAAQEGRQDLSRTPRRCNYRDKDGGRNISGSGRHN